MVQQIVLPIKDSNILRIVQDTLLDSFRAGRRNYTIFQVGKATLLRVSDVMKLKNLMSLIRMVQSNRLLSFMIKKQVKRILCI
ncbi:Uncharacterized protein LACPI_2396 (plasmid) [Lactococcus piscium MKFS47]|uniref:Uncharacterized protein n=1 Tax=Pseudolactococcus piscium MKFS47 TaxID=297352 RepID=A0A0D6E0P6_9LACT|nr:Uncharacterized protein LACPI_2396 [Lactococcus piscium MKFS47]